MIDFSGVFLKEQYLKIVEFIINYASFYLYCIIHILLEFQNYRQTDTSYFLSDSSLYMVHLGLGPFFSKVAKIVETQDLLKSKQKNLCNIFLKFLQKKIRQN